MSLDFKTTLRESLMRTSVDGGVLDSLRDPNNQAINKIFDEVLTDEKLTSIDGRGDAVVLEKAETEEIVKLLKAELEKTNDEGLKKTYEDLINDLEKYNKGEKKTTDAFKADEGAIKGKLEGPEKDEYLKGFANLDATDQEYIVKYYLDKNDTEALKNIFKSLSPEDMEMLVLESTVTVNAKKGLGGYLKQEDYNKMIGLYLESGQDKNKFFDDVINLTKDRDITSKEKQSLITAFEANKQFLSPEQNEAVADAKKSVDKTVGANGGKTSVDNDIEGLYKEFFGEDDLTEIFGKGKKGKDGKESDSLDGRTIKSSVLRSKETNGEALASALIQKNLTSPEHIITVVGDLSPKDQEEFITTLLGELPEAELESMFPFLIGQFFFLQANGVMDDDDMKDAFETLEASTNSTVIKEIFTDLYDVEVEDLTDKSFLKEVNDKDFRSDIMDEWVEIMEASSDENPEIIDKIAKKVVAGESTDSVGDDEKGSSGSGSGSVSLDDISKSLGINSGTSLGSVPLTPIGNGQMFNMNNHTASQSFVNTMVGSGGSSGSSKSQDSSSNTSAS